MPPNGVRDHAGVTLPRLMASQWINGPDPTKFQLAGQVEDAPETDAATLRMLQVIAIDPTRKGGTNASP